MLGTLLALALFAAIGLDAMLTRMRRFAGAVVRGLLCLFLSENAMALTFVQVPTSTDRLAVSQS